VEDSVKLRRAIEMMKKAMMQATRDIFIPLE
jgi:hypothetical protein